MFSAALPHHTPFLPSPWRSTLVSLLCCSLLVLCLAFCLAFGQVFCAASSSDRWFVLQQLCVCVCVFVCLLCVIISFVKLDLLANAASTVWQRKLRRKPQWKVPKAFFKIFLLPRHKQLADLLTDIGDVIWICPKLAKELEMFFEWCHDWEF